MRHKGNKGDTSNVITARRRIENIWNKKNKPFEVTTAPLYSVFPLVFVLNQKINDSNSVPQQAHAVLVPQTFDAFGYGSENGSFKDGVINLAMTANRAITNLTQARCTPGDRDFAVEGISAAVAGHRIRYDDATTASITDAVTQEMYRGRRWVYDPGSIMTCVQQCAPYNLTDSLFHAARPAVTLALEWNQQKIDHLGTLDQVGGGVTDYLTAMGEPSRNSRLVIPEGAVWLHKGNTDGADSELTLKVTVTAGSEVVVPIDYPTNYLGAARTAAQTPTHIILDVRVNLHGVQYFMSSSN